MQHDPSTGDCSKHACSCLPRLLLYTQSKLNKQLTSHPYTPYPYPTVEKPVGRQKSLCWVRWLSPSLAAWAFVLFVLFVPFVLFVLDRNGGVAEALGRVQRASTQGAQTLSPGAANLLICCHDPCQPELLSLVHPALSHLLSQKPPNT
jgi:hypothetical protein